MRERHGWNKVFSFRHEYLDEIPDFNRVRTSQDQFYSGFPGPKQKLDEAGWHFTYLGGPEKVREKLSAFSHDEPWFRAMLAPGGIETQIATGFEVGNMTNFNTLCPIDETFPTYVRENLARYQEL